MFSSTHSQIGRRVMCLHLIVFIGVCVVGPACLANAAVSEDREVVKMHAELERISVYQIVGTMSVTRKQSGGRGIVISLELLNGGQHKIRIFNPIDFLQIALFKNREEIQLPPATIKGLSHSSKPTQRAFEIVSSDIQTEKNLKPIKDNESDIELQVGDIYVLKILIPNTYDFILKTCKPIQAGEYKINFILGLSDYDRKISRTLSGEVTASYDTNDTQQAANQNPVDNTTGAEKK
jgi:hypothetical protein